MNYAHLLTISIAIRWEGYWSVYVTVSQLFD